MTVLLAHFRSAGGHPPRPMPALAGRSAKHGGASPEPCGDGFLSNAWLYPPQMFAREAADDLIGDFRILRGSAVIVAPACTSTRTPGPTPPIQPDRFVRDGRIVTPKAWIPFGTGPRVCIGAAFATMEILTIVRALLCRYRVSLLGDPPSPVGRVMLHLDAQPLFKLTPL